MGWVVNATPLAALPSGKKPGTHCKGGWVGLRASLDGCQNLASTGILSPDRPARTESLYQLSYRGQLAISRTEFC